MVTPLKPLTGSLSQGGYDAASRTLAVQYKPGGPIYQYQGVEPEVGKAFEDADSKGTFVAQNIRNAYDFAKVEPDDE